MTVTKKPSLPYPADSTEKFPGSIGRTDGLTTPGSTTRWTLAYSTSFYPDWKKLKSAGQPVNICSTVTDERLLSEWPGYPFQMDNKLGKASLDKIFKRRLTKTAVWGSLRRREQRWLGPGSCPPLYERLNPDLKACMLPESVLPVLKTKPRWGESIPRKIDQNWNSPWNIKKLKSYWKKLLQNGKSKTVTFTISRLTAGFPFINWKSFSTKNMESIWSLQWKVPTKILRVYSTHHLKPGANSFIDS